MKRTIKKVLLTFLIGVVVAIVGVIILASYRQANYFSFTKTGGELEAKYTAMGSEKVSYREFDAKDAVISKYAVSYPEKIEQSNEKLPVVIFANGTGSTSANYKSFLAHLASWGFIAVGNDDKDTRTGESLNKTIDFLIAENSKSDSLFYQKIDLDNIGIGGHSQGGVAVFNMAGKLSYKDKIKPIYTVSATSSYHTGVMKDGWEYDISLVSAPTFMTAGTSLFDAGTAETKDTMPNEEQKILQDITPLWSLEENYNNLPDDIDKAYARKKDVDHGDSYLQMDGYMTAWFMYWLRGDEEAGKVFFGNNAEIINNELYQDVKVHKAKVDTDR